VRNVTQGTNLRFCGEGGGPLILNVELPF